MVSETEKFLAHNAGFTVVTYAEETDTIITGGSDCLVRMFPPVKDGHVSPPKKTFEHHDGPIRCVAVYKGKLVIASDDCRVTLCDIKNKNYERDLYRSTLPSRCVAFNKDGSKVAIASDNNVIPIISTLNISDVILVKDNQSSVKCVTFDPENNYLVSSSCDGIIRIWDMRLGEPRLIKSIFRAISPTQPDDKQTFPIAWHPSGKYFVIPGKTNDILKVQYIEGTWKYHSAFKDVHKEPVCAIQWSPNGRYLASAGLDCHITIWDAKTCSSSWRYRVDSPATALTWKSSITICYVDEIGYLRFWSPFSDTEISSEIEIQNEIEDSELIDSQKYPAKDQSLEDILAKEYYDDEFVDDDDGAGYVLKRPINEGFNILSEIQKPFHPGATPLQNQHRYLGYNLYGFVSSVSSETYATISVKFIDSSINKSYNFQDYCNLSMSCIGPNGVLHAARSGDGNPSSLRFKLLNSWGTKNEWQVNLPLDEDITAIALSAYGPIVATSKEYVRFFDNSGVQIYLFKLPSIVCISAHDDLVLFVCHLGPGIEGSQNLGYKLYHAKTYDNIQAGPLPISLKSTLKWVGFSKQGFPAIYDSEGLLCVLDQGRKSNQGRWVPMLDTKILQQVQEKGKELNYWPIGIMDQYLMCLKCEKGQLYPSFPSKPVDEVAFQIPLFNLEKTSHQLEEKILRTRLMTNFEYAETKAKDQLHKSTNEFMKKQNEMDKLILQLINEMLKEEWFERAFYLSKTLSTIKGVEAAIMLAQHKNQYKLAERITTVKEKLVREQIQENSLEPLQQSMIKTPKTTPSNQKVEITAIVSSGSKPLEGNDFNIGTISSTIEDEKPQSQIKKRSAEVLEAEDILEIESTLSQKSSKGKSIPKNSKLKKANPFAKMSSMDVSGFNPFASHKVKEPILNPPLNAIVEKDRNKKQSTLLNFTEKEEVQKHKNNHSEIMVIGTQDGENDEGTLQHEIIVDPVSTTEIDKDGEKDEGTSQHEIIADPVSTTEIDKDGDLMVI